MDHKRIKSNGNDDGDRLHLHRHLHEDIVEHIFSFLPIAEAIRAGTTSTRYQTSWHLSSRLLFPRHLALRYSQKDHVDLIEKVFASNVAPQIQAFSLHMDPIGMQSSIEKWLQICIEKQIEELELEFIGLFALASLYLDIQTLRVLKLVNCQIQLPRVLTGLQLLHTLVLRQLELNEEKLEALMSQCKLLVTLDLSECWRIRVVNVSHKKLKALKIACFPNVIEIHIDVPSLRSIFFCGFVITIQFASRDLRLKEAFINILPSRSYLESHRIQHLAIDFSPVTVLTTSSVFLEVLAPRIRNGQYKEMEFCFGNLKELQVYMAGGTFCNPYDVAVFLKSCPCMEVLFIDLNDYKYECGLFWQLNHKPLLDSFPYKFSELKYIKLSGFKFEQYEVELVKVLLQKAINLKALVFTTPKNNPTKLLYTPLNSAYYKHLFLFRSWIASPEAKIYFFGHYEDRSSIIPTHPKYWY